MKRKLKKEFPFTLILSGIRELTPDVLDRLYEAGCDDALIGIREGVAYADFDREAGTFEQAVVSAIRDVERSGLGIEVTRVEPDDFVDQAEIARRTSRSRESVRQLISGQRGPGGFPPPVANLRRRSPIWHWCDVAPWFARWRTRPAMREESTADADLLSTNFIAALNAELEVRRRVKNLPSRLAKMIEKTCRH